MPQRSLASAFGQKRSSWAEVRIRSDAEVPSVSNRVRTRPLPRSSESSVLLILPTTAQEAHRNRLKLISHISDDRYGVRPIGNDPEV